MAIVAPLVGGLLIIAVLIALLRSLMHRGMRGTTSLDESAGLMSTHYTCNNPVDLRPTTEATGEDSQGQAGDDSDTGGALVEVAIDCYDELMTVDVLPALETLSVEQLRDVISRERALSSRPIVIERAQRLIDLTESGVSPGVSYSREFWRQETELAIDARTNRRDQGFSR